MQWHLIERLERGVNLDVLLRPASKEVTGLPPERSILKEVLGWPLGFSSDIGHVLRHSDASVREDVTLKYNYQKTAARREVCIGDTGTANSLVTPGEGCTAEVKGS